MFAMSGALGGRTEAACSIGWHKTAACTPFRRSLQHPPCRCVPRRASSAARAAPGLENLAKPKRRLVPCVCGGGGEWVPA